MQASARNARQRAQDAILYELQDGELEYSELVRRLQAAGDGASVGLLRDMKRRGEIRMYLVKTDEGILHYVSLPDEGVPF